MKKIVILLAISSFLNAQSFEDNSKKSYNENNNFSPKNSFFFEENKGQMKDQYWKARPDVLFYGNSEGMNYFLRNSGISYQLSKIESWKEEEDIKSDLSLKNKTKVPDQIGTYRVDAEWLNFNNNFQIVKGKDLPGYNNYYNVPEGTEPALNVKKYESVILKNIWEGIDIHYYSTDGFLETDYLVEPGADYRQIQMEISGADLSIDTEGYLVMKTSFGEIKEGKLKVYQENQQLEAAWVISEKANKVWQVSFEVKNYNPALSMRIDPVVRVWGTYFGGNDNELTESNFTDKSDNVFVSGRTNSTLGISSGGYQNIISGNFDAFLVKYNPEGRRIWSTYYGGVSSEIENYCTTDILKNIILSGGTFINGNYNAYLVKFDSLGYRIWDLTYGGTGDDVGISCATDFSGNIYLCGTTSSLNNISFNGHQNSIANGSDAFLVKFNSSGIRLWGTYYGSNGSDKGNTCTTDKYGNVYLAGSTSCNIAMPGGSSNYNNIPFNGYQSICGGGSFDAFLVKFDSLGNRIWGSYYGGNGSDEAYSICSDLDGNIYMSGITNSQDSISFNGHQNTISGNSDAFLIKFNNIGNRIWGSYFGGLNAEEKGNCKTDSFGNIYLSGTTYSTNNISYNSYYNFGGYSDAFLVKFNCDGNIKWGTYFGDSSAEFRSFCTLDSKGNLYLAGSTSSINNISFLGFQNSLSGQVDAYLIKFQQPTIRGYVWNDINRNCNREQNENVSLNGVRLIIQPGNYVAETFNGYYYLDSLPAGIYTISIDTTNNNWTCTCPPIQSFTVNNPDSIIETPNFGVVANFPCAEPDVSIVMPLMRRGFSSQIYVQACNQSTATGVLDSAYTIIQLPPEITFQSASLPYTSLGNNKFSFYLGSLNPSQCVNFTIIAVITNQAIANQTLCMSAELYPQSSCVFDSIPTPYQSIPNAIVNPCNTTWDNSSLEVEVYCTGDSVRFVIYNRGEPTQGNMSCYAPVRFYLDGQFVRFDSVQIAGNDSVVFVLPGTGGTWRLEVDQHPLHPGNSRPNASIENCGNGTWTPGIINTMPQNDADPIIDIFCAQVSAPLDPNIKTGFPLGIGTNHNIAQNQQIEYLINFQNVGTDTAVNIIIRDTLSTDLNIYSVQSGVSSFPYEFRMYGPRILEWTFSNIMLPDSNRNEPASHGFVKFTVDQNPNLSYCTVIENRAAIYFDFEAPVITNTTSHRIYNFNVEAPQPSSSSLTQSSCSNFILNGQTYTQSGTYTQVRPNSTCADSTITLNLIIRQPTTNTITQTACSSYSLNGQTYTQSGTYTQFLTNSEDCDSTITLNLTINPLPQVSISNDSTICLGQNLGLFVSGAQTYQWSPAQSLSNPNIANPIASPIQSTQYYVTATGNGNCQTVDSVLVQVRSLPQLIGIGDTICQGETGLLQVSGANNYSWSPNLALSSTTGASVLANPIKTRTYTVIGTDAFGCQGRTNITLIVGKKPAVNLGPDRKVCKGTLVTLDAGNSGASFLWNTGETSQLINTYNPGIYVVKVSTALGCESRDTVVIVLKKCVFYPDVFAASRPTDVHTWEETEWNVYPNPHENFFIIENGEDMIGEKFKIMDLLGRIVLESKIESTRNQIETGFWPAGIYFIQMESRGELKKLIKKQ